MEDKLYSILKISFSLGTINGFTFLIYSFGFWFGGNCLTGTNICLGHVTGVSYPAQSVHIIFFSLLACLIELSTMIPALKQVTLGREAAQRIFKVIDRIPRIVINQGGIKL